MSSGPVSSNGRKREIIELSTGMNVEPALVEHLVRESPLISHCMLYGDGKSYCVALITINDTEAANMCVEQIDGLVQQAVARANARLSPSEQIKRWKIVDREFSAEFDELTPTLKLKRNVVAAHFKMEIEKLYSE